MGTLNVKKIGFCMCEILCNLVEQKRPPLVWVYGVTDPEFGSIKGTRIESRDDYCVCMCVYDLEV